MTQKDWILLLVPVLCNGIVVFVLQKIFEKRKMAIESKYKYVLDLQSKIDNVLECMAKVTETGGNVEYLNQFTQSFVKLHYYYEQNTYLLKKIATDMEKARDSYHKMSNIKNGLIKDKNNKDLLCQMNECFGDIDNQLQKIKKKCVNYKI